MMKTNEVLRELRNISYNIKKIVKDVGYECSYEFDNLVRFFIVEMKTTSSTGGSKKAEALIKKTTSLLYNRNKSVNL